MLMLIMVEIEKKDALFLGEYSPMEDVLLAGKLLFSILLLC